MTIDLAAYLDRIGYEGPVTPTADVLAELHWRHLLAVPFENLDIRPLDIGIRLDLAAIEGKVVQRRRGGFCYELNSLLAAALTEVGFATTMVAVRFVWEDGQLSHPFDHMAVLVQPPGDPTRYLADVGCGQDSPARPLPLTHEREVVLAETGVTARLVQLDDGWRYEQRREDGSWHPVYVFTEIPRQMSDFAERCRYFERDPEAHFTQGPICSRLTPEGRVSMAKGRLIVTRNGERTEQELGSKEAFAAALREWFGVEIGAMRAEQWAKSDERED